MDRHFRPATAAATFIAIVAIFSGILTLTGCAAGGPGPAPAWRLPADAKWTKLNTVAYKGKQDDIYFVDARTGWYVNGAGKIYKTEDGGTTWVEKLSKPGTYFRTIGFIDAQTGFAGNIGTDYFPGVTDTTPLYVTHDGGNTWAAAASAEGPPVKGICSIDVLRTSFINAGHLDSRVVLHAAGRVGGPAFLMRSLDGGASWQSMDLSAYAGMILDVKFFDESTGLVFAASDANIARANGLILLTRDGGKTWTKRYQSARPFESTWKASFPTREIGYATLQSYNPDKAETKRYVLKTVDGGLNWSEIPLVDDFSVRSFGVGFATPEIGWVGTLNSGYQTTNGGKTWERIEFGRAVNKIRIIPGERGFTAYAIGSDVYKLEAFAR